MQSPWHWSKKVSRQPISTVSVGLVLLTTFTSLPMRADPKPSNNLVYEIFVRSWANNPEDSNKFGDLNGIRKKLDYLNDGRSDTNNDLDVGILWLMPIFPSPSNHGYDVTNYKDVNPEYGTLQDLRALVEAAHQRGVRIILDLPFNHTSNQHPWFIEARANPNSRYRKFYHFTDNPPPSEIPPQSKERRWHVAAERNGKTEYYLGIFGATMPDLNLDQPEVQREVFDIAEYWLKFGIDGFRLDAAKNIFGNNTNRVEETDILRNNDWWRMFSDHVYQIKPDAVLVGEVLGDQETFRRYAYGLDGLIDEPFLNAARARLSTKSSPFITNWKQGLEAARRVNADAMNRPTSNRRELFQPFIYLSSHDKNPRLSSELDASPCQSVNPSAEQAYRVGMYILTSLSRYPILYYGDEIMQRGFKWNGNNRNADNDPGDGSGIYDETLREPFPWTKLGSSPASPNAQFQTSWFPPRFQCANDGISVEEQDAPKRMLNLVRGLTNLRTRHPDYANGEVGSILADTSDWMVFEKQGRRDTYLVLINSTAQGLSYEFNSQHFPKYINSDLIFYSDGQNKEWKDETNSNKRIKTSVFVPPAGLVVLRQPRS